MNLSRLASLLTILALLACATPSWAREDDVEIGDEEETVLRSDESATPASDVLEGKEEEDPNRIPSSPDFRTIHVFTQPAKANELIAGKLTRLLVGARNNGTQSYVVESIDGSLRYPQDYSYFIQNFTSLRSEQLVESGLESTFEYLFMPSETFNGRPMGLVVLINYRDNEGKRFQNVVYNQTINFVEADEGFDGETFFLYLFLAAILILLGFVAYQYLLSGRVKRATGKYSSASLASQQPKGNYDVDWIPKHHLAQNRSPRKSPRERKSRPTTEVNGTGAASSENDE